MPSMSARTVVYKGLLLAGQVGVYYRDLQDDRTVLGAGAGAQRFSTNTFPAWELAHARTGCIPQRRSRQHGEGQRQLAERAYRRDRVARARRRSTPKLWPLIYPGQSDTASRSTTSSRTAGDGRLSFVHAMMMMIPEAREQHTLMDDNRRAFYEYHAAMMEPWDGPAAIAFTDGRQIGATLDRNGLGPANISSRTTTSSSWRRKRARCQFPSRRSSRSGVCSRARCS